MNKLDDFTAAYIVAALWSTTDNADETGGEPLDANYSVDDIAPESLVKMVADCAAFQAEHADLLARAGDDAQNGHDFWLTRNGHGAGFWDRGYPDPVGDALSEAARRCGAVDLEVGDDGRIHQS